MDIFDKLYDYQKDRVKEIIRNSETADYGQTVFFGDSIIQSYDLKTYFPNENYYNCGVLGATTVQLLYLHDYAIQKYKPKNIVLMIGTNDLDDVHQYEPLDIVYNVYKLLEIIDVRYDVDNIYILSPLPIDESRMKQGLRDNRQLKLLGKEYEKLTMEFENVHYINLFEDFLVDGQIHAEYTSDGLHITAKGYAIISEKLKEIYKI
ncbi:lysophospholipase L1-like esterase [Breznakia sp. PF5-3]|uniref:SGNH/GDSL hydrolase family protein n=1 Tax=unclassified Breznakia TaxID=2623764 RepID=UPI002406C57B|nr:MULTISPECIES: GDSL-type esterase/lipase family protein [unclassified Breznakia]MDF9825692.1 lysophospholipase L1-like esterase [Breznakia sp. PM6-1]MDF9836527.1 lysophospholipase L1-like esterase [Breznakia sp. PF5-3]MDF9837586.1 lysophospholipase L1-like esterase [Breznakia sp. PFB2-8]MDF9860761.1 lysophospholipase L1-like esterase [Breznakia sp. PH5-24]